MTNVSVAELVDAKPSEIFALIRKGNLAKKSTRTRLN